MINKHVLKSSCLIFCFLFGFTSYAATDTSTQATLLKDREIASNKINPDEAMMLGALTGLGAGVLATPLSDHLWWVPAGTAVGLLAGFGLAVYAADDYAFPSLCDENADCSRMGLFKTEYSIVQQLMAAGATVVNLGDNTVVIIQSQTLFIPGTADFSVEKPNLLNLTAKLVQERDPSQIVVMGSTANIGSPQMQLTLTRAQANAVGRYFARFWGLKKTPIYIAGLGSTKPIANEYTVSGRAKNNAIIISMGDAKGLDYYQRFILSPDQYGGK
ncbi:MAG: putative lipoprotein YiaD [Gammaproteobacteria bacterium]|jgi:outer membrane protein OmpA-like peptidoglycan-associated protein|nr:putative lipoprotein YiaD [Gammaproteobacteria bacterium]